MVAIAGTGWKLAPCLRAMFAEADRRWPKRSHASDGSIGDLAHSARTSDHNPNPAGWVLAGDLTDDKASGCDADLFAEYLRTSRDPRVKYVISNSRIFRSYGSSAWKWTPYTGTNPHDKHTHVSVLDTKEAITDLRPWFSYADAPDPAPPPEEDEMAAPEILYFKNDTQVAAYVKHFGICKFIPTPRQLDILKFGGAVEVNTVFSPFGDDLQGISVIVDGPCKNI